MVWQTSQACQIDGITTGKIPRAFCALWTAKDVLHNAGVHTLSQAWEAWAAAHTSAALQPCEIAHQLSKDITDGPGSHLALLSADVAEHEVLRRGIHLQILHIYGHQRLHRDMQGQETWQHWFELAQYDQHLDLIASPGLQQHPYSSLPNGMAQGTHFLSHVKLSRCLGKDSSK